MDDAMLTIGAAASRCHTSPQTLRRLIRDGQIPAFSDRHDARKVLLREVDVFAIFADDNRYTPIPKAERDNR